MQRKKIFGLLRRRKTDMMEKKKAFMEKENIRSTEEKKWRRRILGPQRRKSGKGIGGFFFKQTHTRNCEKGARILD